jgi:hypothetical protein
MKSRSNKIWDKPLPRIFGVFVLLFSLGTIFWLSRNIVLFESKAAIGNTPKEVQISNISENAFTISYLTDEPVTGSISYGDNQQLSEVAFDDRDKNTPDAHKVHYFTLKNLTPATKYYFSIASGDSIFKDDSKLFEAVTAKNQPDDASPNLNINGKIVLDDGSIPSEGIIYISSGNPTSKDGSQILSTLINPNGSFSLKPDLLLKKDLSGPFSISAATAFNLIATDSTAKSNVSFFAFNANPLPQIILSKNYDFALGSGFATNTVSSESAQVTGFPQLSTGESTTGPAIITPKNDDKLKDQQPLFEGTGLPNSDVEITINSEHEIVATVQTDSNGNWEFRPDVPLEPGEHKITIRSLNSAGILQTITRSFTVFAQGSQFVEPSISPTRTPTPTTQALTPTTAPSPTSLPTATPIIIPTTAATPIVIVPTTATSPVVTSPAPNITTPPIPDAGSSVVTFGLIGLTMLIGIGGLFFLLL